MPTKTSDYSRVPPPRYYDSDDPYPSHPITPSSPILVSAPPSEPETWAIPSDPPTPSVLHASLASVSASEAIPVPPTTSSVPVPATAATTSVALPSLNIEQWTVGALVSLSLGANGRVGSINRDGVAKERTAAELAAARLVPRRGPPAAEKVSRRELYTGHEGSRAHRRWENNNLIGVPNVQPPTPEDLLPKPTHKTLLHLPYHLAATWDTTLAPHHLQSHARTLYTRKTAQLHAGLATGAAKGEVPRDLREAAKRLPVVRGWVRAFEEPVRRWLEGLREKGDAELAETEVETDFSEAETETELETGDKEWVKVTTRDLGIPSYIASGKQKSEEPRLVFEGLGDDEAARMRRWVVHAVAGYYGLHSVSVDLKGPRRRVVWVGATKEAVGLGGDGDGNKQKKRRRRRRQEEGEWHARLTRADMPRALWEVVG